MAENKKEPKKCDEPVSIKIEKAKREITISTVNIQRKYGLPLYIMTLLTESALSEMKDGEIADMVMEFEKLKGEPENE